MHKSIWKEGNAYVSDFLGRTDPHGRHAGFLGDQSVGAHAAGNVVPGDDPPVGQYGDDEQSPVAPVQAEICQLLTTKQRSIQYSGFCGQVSQQADIGAGFL